MVVVNLPFSINIGLLYFSSKILVSKTLNLDDYKEVSQQDLDQVRNDYKRDPLTAMNNAGITIEWNDEAKAKRELSEAHKNRNNPIELQSK